jgi:hypothetical protein
MKIERSSLTPTLDIRNWWRLLAMEKYANKYRKLERMWSCHRQSIFRKNLFLVGTLQRFYNNPKCSAKQMKINKTKQDAADQSPRRNFQYVHLKYGQFEQDTSGGWGKELQLTKRINSVPWQCHLPTAKLQKRGWKTVPPTRIIAVYLTWRGPGDR